MASLRSIVNFVGRIKCNGRVLKDPHEIKDEVVRFFLRTLRREILEPGLIWMHTLPRDFLKELLLDGKRVRRRGGGQDCNDNKAPGPDSFNFAFIKAGWEFLKGDSLPMSSEFHRRIKANREMNATF